MAYLKNWRKSHADLQLFLQDEKDDESSSEQSTHDLHEHMNYEPEIYRGSEDECNSSEDDLNVDLQEFNEDNDFGFLEGNIFSDSETETEPFESDYEESEISFVQELAEWVTECQLKREGINKVLKILRKQGHALPKDARTLLETPKTVEAVIACGGHYKYYAIEIGILKILEQNPMYVLNSNSVDLLVNVDGVPIFKSSSAQFWPIICKFGNFSPFLVALFYGKSKPNSVALFLEDFLDELTNLQTHGLTYQAQTFKITLRGFICDAPARAFLKCTKGHTGYFSCERCTIKGYYKCNRVILYSDEDLPSRTNTEFCRRKYADHQLNKSPLIDHDVNCIEGFCLDYMHLVCLGVVKRILIYLKRGPKECKLSAAHISTISDSLIQLNGKFPSEFARQPRSVCEVDRRKATEFRQFLLYSGPVVLKKVLSKEAYEHFLVLTVAVSILLNADNDKRNSYVEYANQLLHYFVHCSKKIYTEIFVSFNVHNLLHLTSDVINFKCSLNEISAFPFENHLQSVGTKCKKSIGSSH